MAGTRGSVLVVLLVVVMTVSVPDQSWAWTVSCSNPYFPNCYGILQTCPANCPNFCIVDCNTCTVQCACNKAGAVCQDPRFIGGDGTMFYFHGEKDADFCIVSDLSLHINAHFIGKRGLGMTRDFTWVESLGILFYSSQDQQPQELFVGAETIGVWDNHVEALSLKYGGESLALPHRHGAVWKLASAGVTITRTEGKNAVTIEVADSFKVDVHVVPILKEESRIHKYDITSENCFAHLELQFQFFNLSTEVTGVLGQTYVKGFKSPVKIGVPMPIMGGEENFRSSSLMQPDCAVSKFGSVPSSSVDIITESFPVTCDGNSKAGRGFSCRR